MRVAATQAGPYRRVQAEQRPRESRIPALDGLRAVASLMVVFFHFVPQIAGTTDSSFRIFQLLPRRGDEGVALFFVLSGFLISGILVSARNSPKYFRTFYIRRAVRIFPLYYLVLLGYTAAVLVLGSRAALAGRLFEKPLPLWTYFFYLQNFAMAAASSYGSVWMAGSWSLAIEEQFYFTLPALVHRCSDKVLMWIAGTGMVAPLVLRALVQKFRVLPQLSNRLLIYGAVDSLATGVMVMLLLRYHRGWFEARRNRVGGGVLIALALWFIYPVLVTNPRYGFFENLGTSVTAGGTLLYILIAPKGLAGKFLSLGWMRILGNMAYSTYLFHPIALGFAFWLLEGHDPLLNSARDLAPIGLAALATGVLSFASWKFLELPLIQIGHRWKY